MKIYLAGPMRGMPNFNFPLFARATERLRAQGHSVFSPSENDIAEYGQEFVLNNPHGDNELAAKQHGFSLRYALAADTKWICLFADAVALLPGWVLSKGACAEKELGEALGLTIIELGEEYTK